MPAAQCLLLSLVAGFVRRFVDLAQVGEDPGVLVVLSLDGVPVGVHAQVPALRHVHPAPHLVAPQTLLLVRQIGLPVAGRQPGRHAHTYMHTYSTTS